MIKRDLLFQAIQAYVQGEVQIALAEARLIGHTELKRELREQSDILLNKLLDEFEHKE